MPTYEYRCEKCGDFEEFQGINDEPLKECPCCGGEVKRIVGRSCNFLLKGPGFYTTEHRNDKYLKRSEIDKQTNEWIDHKRKLLRDDKKTVAAGN